MPIACGCLIALASAILTTHVVQGQSSLLQLSSVTPRQLDAERFLKALEGRPKAPVQIVVLENDAEALQLALQFQRLLQLATWKVLDLKTVSQPDLVRLANQPSYATAEDRLVGVVVAVLAETQDEFAIFGDREANTPLNALLEAILETLGSVNTYASSKGLFAAPPAATLRLAVGLNPAGTGAAP